MEEFYIGWAKTMPKRHRYALYWVIGILLSACLPAAIGAAYFQEPFAGSQYEFGTPRTLNGTISLQPAPMLRLDKTGQQLLLVGPGKTGGAEQIRLLATAQQQVLNDTNVAVTGRLIYHDGQTAFEIQQIALQARTDRPTAALVIEPLGDNITLRGEITDPKCLLGVMKPGEGITHRECAIRCIAGGITPILKVANQQGESAYYLLCGPDGSPINDCLLPFVGAGVTAKGSLKKIGDWMIFYTEPASLRKIDQLSLHAPMCGQ